MLTGMMATIMVATMNVVARITVLVATAFASLILGSGKTIYKKRWSLIIAITIFIIGFFLHTQQEMVMQGMDLVYECGIYPAIGFGSSALEAFYVQPYEKLVPRYNDMILYVRDGAGELYTDFQMILCAVVGVNGTCEEYSPWMLIRDPVTEQFSLDALVKFFTAIFRMIEYIFYFPSRIVSVREIWPDNWNGWANRGIDWATAVGGCYLNLGHSVFTNTIGLRTIAGDCHFCKFYNEEFDGIGCEFMDGFNITSAGDFAFGLNFHKLCENYTLAFDGPYDYAKEGVTCHIYESHLAQCTAGLLEPAFALFGGEDYMRDALDAFACMVANLWKRSVYFIFANLEWALDIALDRDEWCVGGTDHNLLDALELWVNFVLEGFRVQFVCLWDLINALTGGQVQNLLELIIQYFFGFVWEVVMVVQQFMTCAGNCHVNTCIGNWPTPQDETRVRQCYYEPTFEECHGEVIIYQGLAYFDEHDHAITISSSSLAPKGFKVWNLTDYVCLTKKQNVTISNVTATFYESTTGFPNGSRVQRIEIPQARWSHHVYWRFSGNNTAEGHDLLEYDTDDGYCEYKSENDLFGFWAYPSGGLYECVDSYFECVCSSDADRYRGPNDPGVTDAPPTDLLLVPCFPIPGFDLNIFQLLSYLIKAVDFITCPIHGMVGCLTLMINGLNGETPSCVETFGTWHGSDPGSTTPNVLYARSHYDEPLLEDSQYLWDIYESTCQVIDGGGYLRPTWTWQTPPTGNNYYGTGNLLSCNLHPQNKNGTKVSKWCVAASYNSTSMIDGLINDYVWPNYACRHWIGQRANPNQFLVSNAPVGQQSETVRKHYLSVRAQVMLMLWDYCGPWEVTSQPKMEPTIFPATGTVIQADMPEEFADTFTLNIRTKYPTMMDIPYYDPFITLIDGGGGSVHGKPKDPARKHIIGYEWKDGDTGRPILSTSTAGDGLTPLFIFPARMFVLFDNFTADDQVCWDCDSNSCDTCFTEDYVPETYRGRKVFIHMATGFGRPGDDGDGAAAYTVEKAAVQSDYRTHSECVLHDTTYVGAWASNYGTISGKTQSCTQTPKLYMTSWSKPGQHWYLQETRVQCRDYGVCTPSPAVHREKEKARVLANTVHQSGWTANSAMGQMCQIVRNKGSAFTKPLMDLHCRLTEYAWRSLYDVENRKYRAPLDPNHIWNVHPNFTVISRIKTLFVASVENVVSSTRTPVHPLWECRYLIPEQPALLFPQYRAVDVFDEFVCGFDCMNKYFVFLWTTPLAFVIELVDDIFGIQDCMFGLDIATISYDENNDGTPDVGDRGQCFKEMLYFASDVSTLNDAIKVFDGNNGMCGMVDWIECSLECFENTYSCNATNSGRRKRKVTGLDPFGEKHEYLPNYISKRGIDLVRQAVEEGFENVTAALGNDTFGLINENLNEIWREKLESVGVIPKASTCGEMLFDQNLYLLTVTKTPTEQEAYHGCLRSMAIGHVARQHYPDRFGNINDFMGHSTYFESMGVLLQERMKQGPGHPDEEEQEDDEPESTDVEYEQLKREESRLPIEEQQRLKRNGEGSYRRQVKKDRMMEKRKEKMLKSPTYKRLRSMMEGLPEKTVRSMAENLAGELTLGNISPSSVFKQVMSEVIKRAGESSYWKYTQEMIQEVKDKRRQMAEERASASGSLTKKRRYDSELIPGMLYDVDPIVAERQRMVHNEMEMMSIYSNYAQKIVSEMRLGKMAMNAVESATDARKQAIRFMSDLSTSKGDLPEMAKAHELAVLKVEGMKEKLKNMGKRAVHIAQVLWNRYDLSHEPLVQQAVMMRRASTGELGDGARENVKRYQKGEINYLLEEGFVSNERYALVQRKRTSSWKRGILPVIMGLWERPVNVTYALFMIFKDIDVSDSQDQSVFGLDPNVSALNGPGLEAFFQELNSTNRKSLDRPAHRHDANVFIFDMADWLLYKMGLSSRHTIQDYVDGLIDSAEEFTAPVDLLKDSWKWLKRSAACQVPYSLTGEGGTFAWSPFCLPALYQGLFTGWASPSAPNIYYPMQIEWPGALVEQDCSNGPYNGDRLFWTYHKSNACRLKIHHRKRHPWRTLGDFCHFDTALVGKLIEERYGGSYTALLRDAVIFSTTNPLETTPVFSNVTTELVEGQTLTLNVTFASTFVNNYFTRNYSYESIMSDLLECTETECASDPSCVESDFCGFDNFTVYAQWNTSASVENSIPDVVIMRAWPLEKCLHPFCQDFSASTFVEDLITCDTCVRRYHTCSEYGFSDVLDTFGYLVAIIPVLAYTAVAGTIRLVTMQNFVLRVSFWMLWMVGPFAPIIAHFFLTLTWLMAFIFEVPPYGSGLVSIGGLLVGTYHIAKHFFSKYIKAIPLISQFWHIFGILFLVQKFGFHLPPLNEYSLIPPIRSILDFAASITFGVLHDQFASFHERLAVFENIRTLDDINAAYHFCFWWRFDLIAMFAIIVIIVPMLFRWVSLVAAQAFLVGTSVGESGAVVGTSAAMVNGTIELETVQSTVESLKLQSEKTLALHQSNLLQIQQLMTMKMAAPAAADDDAFPSTAASFRRRRHDMEDS